MLARTIRFANSRKEATTAAQSLPQAHWMELKLIQSKKDIENPEVKIKAQKLN